MAKTKTPGVSIAVAEGGTVRLARAYGQADLESNSPVTPETLFPTASTFKPITATAILKLAADRKISLDDPIQKYCPAFPAKPSTITIRHLLTHTSGVRHFSRDEIFNTRHFAKLSDVAAFVGTSDLLFEPGAKKSYSNFGYSLLACAVEGASGKPFDEYLGSGIFRAAGMTRTRPDMIYRVIPNRARGYIVRTAELTKQWDGLWQPGHVSSTLVDQPFRADAVDYSMEIGAGGYLSTPSDLVRFGTALMDGKLVPDPVLQQMFRAPVTGEAPDHAPIAWINTPLGDTKASAPRVIGADWTGSAGLLLLPDKRIAISVMTNVGFAPPDELASEILKIWQRH